MARRTDEQLALALAWIEHDLDVPGKAEWYEMQTACQITRAHAKSPGSVDLKAMRLKFNKRRQGRGKAEEHWRDAFLSLAHADAMARGFPVTIKRRARDGSRILSTQVRWPDGRVEEHEGDFDPVLEPVHAGKPQRKRLR